MIFADLAAGDAVFVDANAFIYAFAPDRLCTRMGRLGGWGVGWPRQFVSRRSRGVSEGFGNELP
jgi:hypothetical protein